jgi:hypothetical protein
MSLKISEDVAAFADFHFQQQQQQQQKTGEKQVRDWG